MWNYGWIVKGKGKGKGKGFEAGEVSGSFNSANDDLTSRILPAVAPSWCSLTSPVQRGNRTYITMNLKAGQNDIQSVNAFSTAPGEVKL